MRRTAVSQEEVFPVKLGVAARFGADEFVITWFLMDEIVPSHIFRVSRRILAGSVAALVLAGFLWIVDIQVMSIASISITFRLEEDM